MLLRLTAALALIAALTAPAAAHPVLMISIDGLRPGDITDAPARGLKVPTLRAIMADGAWASGVRDVLPTVTYPNHTTLVTGVAPALHGITNNTAFDPLQKNMDGWYWYARDIKVATLWDAAHNAGIRTASLGWPVTVGAASIDYDIPEYWRTFQPDDAKLENALATPGLVDALSQATHVDAFAIQTTEIEADDAKTAYAIALIEAKHPGFMTLHLSSLDHNEHKFGPGTPQTNAILERIDADVGRIVAAARKAMPDLVVAIVSDHGFAAVQHDTNLMPAFVAAGLVTLDPENPKKVKTWDAEPWSAGGSFIVKLAHPDDAAVKAKVSALLAKLAADPANGIAKVIGRDEIATMGGGPDADFWVDLNIGYEAGNAFSGPVVTDGKNKGMHGYFPTHAEMHSTFLIDGPGLPKKALGEIDMRDIAPTLAKILGVTLPQATGRPLF